MEEKRYTYRLDQTDKLTPDNFPLTEQGGPASEAEIERLVQRHFEKPYFEEQEDGRILIFRSNAEASDVENAVGEVIPVE